MKEAKTDTERLFEFLLTGARIACKDSYRLLKIPDLRSRVCDVQKNYNVTVQRKRVEGKAYNEYYFSPIPKELR